MNTIGNRLYEAMDKAGFKRQADLAIESGVPQPTISRILKDKGRRGPESDTIVRLARACGVAASWLLSGEGEPTSETASVIQNPLTLMYVTTDEIELLTAYRLAPDENKKRLLLTAHAMPRDRVKLEEIKHR